MATSGSWDSTAASTPSFRLRFNHQNKLSRQPHNSPTTRPAVSRLFTQSDSDQLLKPNPTQETLSRSGPRTRSPLSPRDPNSQDGFLSKARSTLARSNQAITASAAARKMPPGDARPRQPQLAVKGFSRTPLTPKIAAKTPPLRRVGNQPTPTVVGYQTRGDDLSSRLGSNVTPRSGQRQARAESSHNTPVGTPNLDKNNDGLNRSTSQPEVPRQDGQNDSADAKFFYASDAKTGPTVAPQPKSTLGAQQPVSFFYAQGTMASSERSVASPSPTPSTGFTPVLGLTQEPVATKFFYANGVPDALPRPSLTPSASGSVVSNASKMTSTRPISSGGPSQHAPGPYARPVSPVKAASTPSVTALRSAATSPTPTGRPQLAAAPTLAPNMSSGGKRRVSIDNAPKPSRPRGHARTGSVPVLDVASMLAARSHPLQLSPEQLSPPMPLSPGLSQPTMTMASLLQAVEDLGEEPESEEGDLQSGLQSPTKSVADPISELVANARRERKVQDLEITNASLEAINRTLERQLRKQTTELRRFRRLSRSGRFSIASAASSRVPSETLTEPPLSDLSEEEDMTEEEEEDSPDDDANSLASGGPLSPSSLRITKRRKRDEMRLELDLSKHQELLVDSQKLNQSIKRCLGWTEDLIKEGQKALAYNVRVSDVELGGHVLTPLDEEEEDEVMTAQRRREESLDPWEKGTQDRDSGVEMPVDGG